MSASDLQAADAATRLAAAEQLASAGEAACHAVVALVRAAGDSDDEVREAVVAVLEELGPPATADVEELAGLLAVDNSDVAYWAATLLGRLEEAGSSAVPALAAALGDSRPGPVRERAAWALGKIGAAAAPARQALQAAADSGEARLARLAQQALENL